MKSAARLLPWFGNAAFWLGVGLFFSLAEWQHYMRAGGMHPWEPFPVQCAQPRADRTTLAAFLSHPAAARFVRVHRSCAVQPSQVLALEPLGSGDARLRLASGRCIRLSRAVSRGVAGGVGAVKESQQR